MKKSDNQIFFCIRDTMTNADNMKKKRCPAWIMPTWIKA
jgi:hypothetical protein